MREARKKTLVEGSPRFDTDTAQRQIWYTIRRVVEGNMAVLGAQVSQRLSQNGTAVDTLIRIGR